uniref:contractile injection system tape measure protein n=1 Tax=Algoriphagus sp. TaxID=1872435 RepID=UPI004047CDF6
MPNHVVNSLKFEINVTTQTDYEELATQVSELVQKTIAEIIDEAIEELYPKTDLIVIKKLEIDLGDLKFSNLKSDLVKKFKIQFFEALKNHLGTTESQITNQKELPFLILDSFIQTGKKPSWIPGKGAYLKDFFKRASLQNPKKLVARFRHYLKNPTHKKRMLESVPEEVLVDILFVEQPISQFISSEEVLQIKSIFRTQFRHLDEGSVERLFKNMLLELLVHPQKINQWSTFQLVILEALQQLIGIESLQIGKESLSQRELKFPQLKIEQVDYDNSLTKQVENNNYTAAQELLAKFKFFLFNGYNLPDRRSSSYSYRNINSLFEALLNSDLQELIAFLLQYGKIAGVKRRFLDQISQDLFTKFFGLVAPEKRKLLEWVGGVFEKVQEEYQPINQTLIQVKKSLNEITFDLFLNKNLNSISDESYLRLLFKKTAQKYGISYKKLLFLTLKAISFGELKGKNFGFEETLINLYSKDFLRKNQYSISEWIMYANENRVPITYSNSEQKEDWNSLFLQIFKHYHGSVTNAAKDWLANKDFVKEGKASVMHLWEAFSRTFHIPIGDFLIPVLLDRRVTSDFNLDAKSFVFWVTRYKISGVYFDKAPNVKLFLGFLNLNRDLVSLELLKKVLMGLPVPSKVEKELLTKLVHLIRPTLASHIVPLFDWLSVELKEKKVDFLEQSIYRWLYSQLLLLPQNQLTLVRLKRLIIDYLNLKLRPISNYSFHLAKPASVRISSNFSQKTSNVSSKSIALIFEILGYKEIYEIFKEAKRYNEEILFQMMLTKYASSFYQLLFRNRHNLEFQDAVLVQSPTWLKKQLIDFLLQKNSLDWVALTASYRTYFEDSGWIKLEGRALENFIEKILWHYLYDGGKLHRDLFVIKTLHHGHESNYLTKRFWKDLEDVFFQEVQRIAPSKNPFNLDLLRLSELEQFSYFSAILQFKKTKYTLTPIFERLVYEFKFPGGHDFEGSIPEEFEAYIQRLVVENKQEFIDFLKHVKPKFLGLRFLKLLDLRSLEALVLHSHKQLRIRISIRQIQEVLRIFKIQEPKNISIFYSSWLLAILEVNSLGWSTIQWVTQIVKLIFENNLVSIRQSSDLVWENNVVKAFQWNASERIEFKTALTQLGFDSSFPPFPLVFENKERIQTYFMNFQDSNLASLKGKIFFSSWLDLFFEIASKTALLEFVDLFWASFYSIKGSNMYKFERFMDQFLLLKEGIASFQRAREDEPKNWAIFQENAPSYFRDLEESMDTKSIGLDLFQIVTYFLRYGVLPKGYGSLAAFSKLLMQLSGSELIRYRGVFFAALKSSVYKKNVIKLVKLLDEKWFYNLIHPTLNKVLEQLNQEIKQKTGTSLFTALRLNHPLDRALFLIESGYRSAFGFKEVTELVVPLVEEWVVSQKVDVALSVFASESKKSKLLLEIQKSSKIVKKVLEEAIEEQEEVAEEIPEEVDLGEGVTIYNAGMVLCWPFFGRFFAALGLVEMGNFKGKQAEERAVQLLQFLTTGLKEFEEWDLSLNKILCGVSLNTVISSTIEPTIEEEELVKKLINGTVFNWEKMRGTKLETFRETFLMREGRLYEKDNRWELFVERKAYDVLMDTLTWNISMINLSWMKKRLTVQWK